MKRHQFSISTSVRSCYLILVIVAVLVVSNAASQTSLPVSSGLQLWLRSDMGVTLDGNGAVQTWADQSGSGHHFTQDTADARPTLVAGAGPRGADVLHFDGVDDVLRNPAQIVGGTSVTIFTVMAVREPGYPWVLGESYSCDTQDGLLRRLFYEGHPGGGVDSPDFFDVADDCWNDERASFPGINDTQFKVLTITGSDRIYNVRVFVNGAAATMTPQSANIEVRFSPGNTLGFVHTTPNDYTVVDVAEFIVYDRELNQTERESVEAYLMSRYFPQGIPGCVQPPPGLVSWWPGEGNAIDVVSGDSGTLQNGVSFMPGKVGQAFQFDGIDDFILVPHEEKYDFGGGPYSFALWVQTLAGREYPEHIFSKGNLWGGNNDYVMWIGGGPYPAGVVMEYGWPDSNYLETTRYVSHVNDGVWHHVVVTQSGACAGCWMIYLDGVLEDTKFGKLAAHGTEDFIIGGTYSGSFYPYKGGIDELAVFNRALTDAEVRSLFSAGSAGMCTNQPPLANAGPDQTAIVGGVVQFDGSGSSDPDGTIASFDWDFGDGSQGQGATVGHTYTSIGTFTVTLTVTDNGGLTASDSSVVTVQQPPAITSPNSTTFVLGAFNSFTVTATGLPTPTITQTGSLPLGIGFSDHLDGTGILSGTPTTGGTFPISFTASNDAGKATQSFTLTVSGPLATLSPASIDWSEVYLWSLLPKTLTLANIGTSALTISKISLALGANTDSNDFGYLSFCGSTLAAGKSCLILVSLWADEVGSKSATLSVTDNSPGSPQQASLTAKIINPVGWVSPVALTYGTIRVGSSSMKSVQLTNKGSTDLKVTGFAITGSTDFAQTNNCPASLAPGASCRIDVTFTPTAKTARAAVLKITDNDRLGMQLVVLTGKGN